MANKFRSDVAELMQGVRNANDGLSTLQIIDGGLNNVSKILDRLKTLATQSASSTFTGNRATLNNEFQSLLGKSIARRPTLVYPPPVRATPRRSASTWAAAAPA